MRGVSRKVLRESALVIGASALSFCSLAAAQSPPSPSLTPAEQKLLEDRKAFGNALTEKQIYSESFVRGGVDRLGQFSDNLSGFIAPGNASSNARRFALPGQGQTGAAGAAGGSLWNAWVAFSQNKVGYSFQPLQTSGTINAGVVGVDYTLANRMIVGVAVASDKSDIALNFNGGTLKGTGWTIAPYLAVPLNRNLALDATLGVGRAKVDANGAGLTASFNADRTIGSIGLTYRDTIGNWQLSGRGAFLAVSDKLGAYTLSNGTFVQGGSVDIQQLRFGGQAGYKINNSVTPYVGLTYVYDVRRPDQQPVGGQSAANDRDAWVPMIGLRFSSGGAVYGGVQYSSEQSRSQVKNNQLLLNLGVKF